MKKNLLILFFFILQFTNAQTNIYHPFPDSSAHWNMNHLGICWFTGGYAIENYSIEITNDTIINSINYHKLNTPYIQILSTGICGGNIQLDYQGAIRQDTMLKQVYIVPAGTNAEQLLYDFSLQVGDTVKGYLETMAVTTDTVVSIDSVIVGSSYRKRWKINPCYNIYLIEGVGSTFGLLGLSPGCITDADDFSLTCFQQNGQSQYPITSSNCELITSIKSNENPFAEIKLYPNPASNTLTFFENENTPLTRKMSIYDGLGNLVLEIKKLVNNQLDITNLNNGFYLIRYSEKETTKILKFIKYSQ